MGDEAAYGYVQMGERRVYVEVLTEELREGLQDDDRRAARELEASGSAVGVMYEVGVPPSVGTYGPNALVPLSKGEFLTARDMRWPRYLPGTDQEPTSGHGGELLMGGELSLEVTRAADADAD